MLKPRGLYSRNSSSQGDSLCHAKHGLSWARAIILKSLSTLDYDRHYISMHTVDGRSAQAGRPSPRYCLHGRQDARFGETNGLVSDGYGYGVIPILHLAHEKCLPLLATFTMERPPNARTDPQCDSHLHSVVHSGRTPSTCSCTLSTTLYAQRTTAPHARRGSAHFLEKREPLALGS